MKQIPLTQGKFALVDDADFEYLNQWKWHINAQGYAVRTHHIGYKDGKRITKKIRLHREIMQTPYNRQTDHINGDRLDNQRQNLRICSHQENNLNKGNLATNTSGFKGVHWYKVYKKWSVKITVNRKNIFLGYYSSLPTAVKTYNQAALKYHGEFARLNDG